MHPKVRHAFQEIDAALFNGDDFDDPEDLAHLHWLARWQRKIETCETSHFKTLTFADLAVGDRFVTFPEPGDDDGNDDGNGGYLGSTVLWTKAASGRAMRLQIDQLSQFEPDAKVRKVES